MGRENYQALKLLGICLVWFAASCKPDKPFDPVAPITIAPQDNIYTICEGSLGNGNSSLSLFVPKSNQSYSDVYQPANNKPLGDVFQSMALIDGRFFMCVNNSDKIVVINKSDNKEVGSINVPKPRYILYINPAKAYVSTLFSNKVYIINPQTLSVTGTITMPYQNPEGMLLYNNSVYVCAWDTANNKLIKVNSLTDQIEKEILIAGYAPQEAVFDRNDIMWVLSGNVVKGKQAALTCIDPKTDKSTKSFIFSSKADPIRPVFDNSRQILYFIEVNYQGGTSNNGVYRMDINDALLPTTPFVAATQYQYFWALGISPVTGKIYIGDPKGFTQKGSVAVYDSTGFQVSQFNTGIGPGHFYFDQ